MDERQTPGGAKKDRRKMMEKAARNAVFARERMRAEKQGESRGRNLRDLIPGLDFDNTEEALKASRERYGAARREASLRRRGRGN
jgi:hypothetical protein